MDASLCQLARVSRDRLLAGALTGGALEALLASVPFLDRDAFVDELLQLAPPPPDEVLPAGAVPYLPCPVAELRAVIHELPITAGDEVVILGAGLGRAAFVIELLAGARVHGIEIQRHLVERARATAGVLGLASRFEHGNLADADLEGAVVFLFAPCNGELLARVSARIAALAARRRIAVAAVGVELPLALRARASSLPGVTFYYSE